MPTAIPAGGIAAPQEWDLSEPLAVSKAGVVAVAVQDPQTDEMYEAVVSGSTVVPLTPAHGIPMGAAFSPDGRFLVVAWDPVPDKPVRLGDSLGPLPGTELKVFPADGRVGRTITLDQSLQVDSLAMDPGGKDVYVTTFDDIATGNKTLYGIDLADGHVSKLVDLPDVGSIIAVDNSGAFIMLMAGNGTGPGLGDWLARVEPNRRVVALTQPAQDASDAGLATDGYTLFFEGRNKSGFAIWTVSSRGGSPARRVTAISVTALINGEMAPSPDGRAIWSTIGVRNMSRAYGVGSGLQYIPLSSAAR